jgi:hypothetical protein
MAEDGSNTFGLLKKNPTMRIIHIIGFILIASFCTSAQKKIKLNSPNGHIEFQFQLVGQKASYPPALVRVLT